MMLQEFRSCIKLPRKATESDEQYHRRLATISRTTRTQSNITDLDAYVLGRMYDFVGHVIRMGCREPNFLPCVALRHRDKEWCLQRQEIMGSQGHHGRVHPWTHEKQFLDYFTRCDLNWKQVAQNKEEWQSHRKHWLTFKYGCRCTMLKLF